jgi:hypothetical protein
VVYINFDKPGTNRVVIYDVLGRPIHLSETNLYSSEIRLPETVTGSSPLQVVDENDISAKKLLQFREYRITVAFFNTIDLFVFTQRLLILQPDFQCNG